MTYNATVLFAAEVTPESGQATYNEQLPVASRSRESDKLAYLVITKLYMSLQSLHFHLTTAAA